MSACAIGKPGMGISGIAVNTYGRDLGRKGDRFRDGEVPLLDRALEVDVRDLLAEIRARADKADKTVLDLEEDVGTLLNDLRRVASGLDDELLAAVGR